MGSDYSAMLAVAIAEARKGLAEGGIPIGAAIFDESGKLIGAGHNRRVQNGDSSLHGETDAFRNAGRQRSYRKLIMVTTLAPVLVLQRPGAAVWLRQGDRRREPKFQGWLGVAAFAGSTGDRS